MSEQNQVNVNSAADAQSSLNVRLGNPMTFGEALEKLGIPEYGERIINSNSHGELFHLLDYIQIAQLDDVSWFRVWFLKVVEYAEMHWKRPESVFQHILTALKDSMSHNANITGG